MPKQNTQKIKLPADGSVQAALQRVRARTESKNDADNAMWVVFGYSDKVTLEVVAEGMGGLDEAKEHVPSNKEMYIYLKKGWQVEMSYTNKFAYVDWTPDSLGPMRKALLTTHKGQVEDLMKPFHTFLKASRHEELDDSEIMNKIAEVSGTKIHQTDKKASGNFNATSRATARGATPSSAPKAVTAPVSSKALKAVRGITLVNPDEFKAAVAAVRSETDPSDWLVVNYKDTEVLEFVASGAGGPGEIIQYLDPKNCIYAYFRTTQQVDSSVTVKFGFLRRLGLEMSPMKKSKITTHRGFVNNLFGQFHFELDQDSRDEFSAELVAQRTADITLQSSKVRTADEAAAAVPEGYTSAITLNAVNAESASHKTVAKRQDHVNTKSSGLKFDNKAEVVAAIADVRDDKTATTWMIAGYPKKNTVNFIASGAGDIDFSSLAGNEAYFALVRVTDQIDRSVTVKFAFLKIIPDNMSPMKKSSLTLVSGALDDFFHQYHVQLRVTSSDEVPMTVIIDKVKAASGTKVWSKKKA